MKVLKFGAVWCSGCLVMKPRWKKIEEMNPWLKNEYYDFDMDKEAVERYGIDDILPTFVFVNKEGEEFMRIKGEIEEERLLEIINKNKEK